MRIDVEPVDLRLAVIVKAGRERGRAVENTDRDVDALGARLEAETNAAAAGGTKAAPADVARIIATHFAMPGHLAAVERRKRRDRGAGRLAAHRAVAVRDATRWRRSFEAQCTAETGTGDGHRGSFHGVRYECNDTAGSDFIK